jgi:glycerol kinase
VAYQFGQDRKAVYALEGSIAVAGSGVKFLVNNFGFASHSDKISELAATVKDNGGCVFVTAFSGLFAPYWIDDAKGTIFGITQHTERGHIARATLESTCFQTKAILDAMEKDSSHVLAELAVDGVSEVPVGMFQVLYFHMAGLLAGNRVTFHLVSALRKDPKHYTIGGSKLR